MTYAFVSDTLGVTGGRLCIGEASRGDIGCPTYAPSLTTAGDISVTGNLSAAAFIGDGSGLTGITAGGTDRITSGTTNITAASNQSLTFTTAGTQRMVIGATGNVGVGTTNPQAILDLVTPNSTGASSGETYGLRIQDGANSGSDGPRSLRFGVATGSNGAGYIQYSYEGTTFGNDRGLWLNPYGGNVAIGHSQPMQKLDVSGTILARGGTGGFQPGGKLGFSVQSNVYSATPAYIGGYYDKASWSSGVALIFATIAGADISGANGIERMRISSDGNVGIGTTAPTATLQVSGSFTVSTSAQTTTPSLYVGTNGNVGVGLTDPDQKLEVAGTIKASNGGAVYAELTTSGLNVNNAGPLRIDHRSIGQDIIVRTSNGSVLNATPMTIKASGNVGIGTTNPSATLDVSGTIKLAGTGSETCNSTSYGTTRLNPITKRPQMCRP